MNLGRAFAILAGALLLGAAPPRASVDAARLMADEPAPALSAYGLFADGPAQKPAPGVVAYDLQTPLFSDYALKRRFLFLPAGARAGYRAQGVIDLPVGAVLIKTFAFPADLRAPEEKVRLIETRLLIHRPDGWRGLTYVWNGQGSDALLNRAGARVAVEFDDARGVRRQTDYQVPNVNQCKECHGQSGALTPLGPKARNLNRDLAYPEGSENQLARGLAVVSEISRFI